MAALASSRQPPAPAQQLTPPSSSHGGREPWDFAVPLDNADLSNENAPYMSQYASAQPSRQPLTSQANGFAKPVRSPTWDSQGQYHENDGPQIASERLNELHKKPSANMSLNSSDQESLQEYYKGHNARRAPPVTKAKGKKKPTKAGTTDPNWNSVEYDANNWIHRDKLKEIETRELEEAGFLVGRSSRSNSRSRSATRGSRDRGSAETNELAQYEDQADARHVVSPIPAADEEVFEDYHTQNMNAEDASEYQPASPRGHHAVKPSTSRIPLKKSSGIPVPAAGADAPLTRSRTGSSSWNADAANGVRGRSGSIGSQALLDDTENGRQITPPNGHVRKGSVSNDSPAKSPIKKPAGKGASGPTTRKTGAQKTQPKNRQASGHSPPKRPSTSSGSISRPTTSHRPEGEAPWLATMYKPDPRLPPDQQIIPTHAKRMQQEQWENEGKIGSMYDKDFRLVNTDEMKDKRLSQLQPIDIEKAQQDEAWPLPSPTKQQQSQSDLERNDTNNMPKSPTTEQGGYKLTPSVSAGPPRGASPKLAPPIAGPEDPKPPTTRIPEPVEEVREKKGCCCIVM